MKKLGWIGVVVLGFGAVALAGGYDESLIKRMEKTSDTCKKTSEKLDEANEDIKKNYTGIEKLLDMWKKRKDVSATEKKQFEEIMDKVLKNTKVVEDSAKDLLNCGKELEGYSDKLAH